ncbi:glycosyl hydrolase family 28-related protein [Tengunoibacter tsumagoiensis]|uniref:glycosyl hydrolase family 28-related protein n=1 Tax=Tengunoibacter tsumagoiensis TaxID=2014871 RepID=UPI0013875C02|nr:glycosyl hydrolase family 28-related protein [Tengunoibacter tsumagoiensis]
MPAPAQYLLFSSGFEATDPPLVKADTDGQQNNVVKNVTGICCQLTGPQVALRGSNEPHFQGERALLYSGMPQTGIPSQSSLQIYRVHISITSSTTFSYWIYPTQSASQLFVNGVNSCYVVLDLHFTDGQNDAGITDQNGTRLTPQAQGSSGHLQLNQWNYVSATLGASFAGKIVDRISVSYAQSAPQPGGYRGYIDNIQFTNDLITGFEASDPPIMNSHSLVSSRTFHVHGICCGVTGPEIGVRGMSEPHHEGRQALVYAGFPTANLHSYVYQLLYRVNIPIYRNTTLAYWIYPQANNGSEYIVGQNSRSVAIDLHFTDNSTLSDSGATDQYGVRLSPQEQGKGDHLILNSWNYVSVNLGQKLAGKTVDSIAFVYEQQHPLFGGYRGYIDDLSLLEKPDWARPVPTIYPTEDIVIANRVLTASPYMADATGHTDISQVLNQALRDCYTDGGGVVWLPAGRYKVTQSIDIPPHCTLRGDRRDPDQQKPSGQAGYGTLILASPAPSADDNAPGLFRLWESSGVKGLTIYYPQQSLGHVQAYPYTFEIAGAFAGSPYAALENFTIENITMLNSYRGIIVGKVGSQEMATLRNIVGTVLYKGLVLQNATDIGRVEQITLSNAYWAQLDPSVSTERPARTDLDLFTHTNGYGILLSGLDWDQFAQITLSNYRIALSFLPAHTFGPGLGSYNSSSLALIGIKITNSFIGMAIDYINNANGLMIANSQIQTDGQAGSVAILIHNSLRNNRHFPSVLFNAVLLGGGTGQAVVLAGHVTANFQNCTFETMKSSAAIIARQGNLIVQDSHFLGSPSSTVRVIGLQPGLSSAAIVSNQFASGENDSNQVDNRSMADVKIDSSHPALSEQALLAPSPDSSLPQRIAATFSAVAFYNVKLAPYNASGDGITDDTISIQSALNDAARAGGGIVYLPPAIYAIRSHLTIPVGVMLRGSDDVQHRGAIYGSSTTGTILYAYEGRNSQNPQSAPAFLTLVSGGVRGITIYYPEQLPTSVQTVASYPWSIRGLGSQIYLHDITLPNAYKAIETATIGAAQQSLQEIMGSPLNEGINLQGEGEGWLLDSHFNLNFWKRAYGLPGQETSDRVITAYQSLFLHAFTIGDHIQQAFLANNFIYDSLAAYTFSGNAHISAQNIAADMSRNTITTIGSGKGVITIINAEICCHYGTQITMHGGNLTMLNVLGFNSQGGIDPEAVQINEGNLLIQGAAFDVGSATIISGRVIMKGVLFKQGGVQIRVRKGAIATFIADIGGGSQGLHVVGASSITCSIHYY